MLTEFVIVLAFLLLQNKLQAFLLFCLVFLILGVSRWFSNREEITFMQSVGRAVARAWAVFRRASLASTIVAASVLLFVAGVLGIWVLPFVASLAVWGVWRKWKATAPTQQPDSGLIRPGIRGGSLPLKEDESYEYKCER